MSKRVPPLERFTKKYRVLKSGCWMWQGYIDPLGYGRFTVTISKGKYKMYYAHVWAYEHFNGTMPNGTEIDHLCHNRTCVNPQHLEAVTHRENVLRGYNPMAIKARATHCPRGHRYDPRHTYPGGHRICRVCKTEHGYTGLGKWDVAKLSETQKMEVRKLYKTGKYTYRELATMFDVGRSTIWRALSG